MKLFKTIFLCARCGVVAFLRVWHRLQVSWITYLRTNSFL